ncbi:MAG: tetratricopeptide repeat protein [Deltaproteobacteria bacterium]|nr:tetratricopeptide repeat protein [Deltaproteobacteria bacterium]
MNEYSESRPVAPRKKYEFLLIVLMAVVTFFVYTKTLTGDFIFDDGFNIKYNSHIRIKQITAESLLDAGFKGPAKRRPVPKITFALNYYFHGNNVIGFHMVNILIHIANGLLLYLLVNVTWSTPALRPYRGKYGWITFFTAFIWLVHPIQTQAVSYMVQRMTSLATMFYVLSLLCYIQARIETGNIKKVIWFCVMPVSGILALGSKEISTTLPFFIFLYEWYFFQDLSMTWIKKRIPLIALVLVLLGIISLMYLGGHPIEKITSMYANHPVTMTQRVLTQMRVVILYISLLLWPHPGRLNLAHDFQTSHSMLDPATTLLSMAAIIVFVVAAVLTAKRHRLISFCILWYFGNLVIESSVIALEPVFEHRNYLPSMFFIFLVVFLFWRYLKPKWLAPLLLCVSVFVCSLWTFERNEVWRSPILMWKDSIKKSPQYSRPYNNLGVALMHMGLNQLAEEQFRRAIEIDPKGARAHTNLGYVLAQQGHFEEAIQHLTKALEIDPKHYEIYNNLGLVMTLQGHYREAIEYFFITVAIKPNYTHAHNNLGKALVKEGRLKEAIEHFKIAIDLDPAFEPAYNNMGMALVDLGHPDEAIVYFKKALEIKPDYAAARQNLEETLAKKQILDK